MQKRLKQLRKERGINQTELAEYLGITQPGVVRIESGKQLPTIKQLVKLKILYKKSLDYLIEGE